MAQGGGQLEGRAPNRKRKEIPEKTQEKGEKGGQASLLGRKNPLVVAFNFGGESRKGRGLSLWQDLLYEAPSWECRH